MALSRKAPGERLEKNLAAIQAIRNAPSFMAFANSPDMLQRLEDRYVQINRTTSPPGAGGGFDPSDPFGGGASAFDTAAQQLDQRQRATQEEANLRQEFQAMGPGARAQFAADPSGGGPALFISNLEATKEAGGGLSGLPIFESDALDFGEGAPLDIFQAVKQADPSSLEQAVRDTFDTMVADVDTGFGINDAIMAAALSGVSAGALQALGLGAGLGTGGTAAPSIGTGTGALPTGAFSPTFINQLGTLPGLPVPLSFGGGIPDITNRSIGDVIEDIADAGDIFDEGVTDESPEVIDEPPPEVIDEPPPIDGPPPEEEPPPVVIDEPPPQDEPPPVVIDDTPPPDDEPPPVVIDDSPPPEDEPPPIVIDDTPPPEEQTGDIPLELLLGLGGSLAGSQRRANVQTPGVEREQVDPFRPVTPFQRLAEASMRRKLPILDQVLRLRR